MSIPIGVEFGSNESLSLVKSSSCPECRTDFLYRVRSPRLDRQTRSGLAGAISCPACGWSQSKKPKTQAKSQSKASPGRSIALLSAGLGLIAGADVLLFHSTLLGYWPVLLGVWGLGSGILYLKSQSSLPPQPGTTRPSMTLASRAVALYDVEPGEGPNDEALERELYSCLRSAMLSMAAIDGDIDPSELMAISGVYQNVTSERVDVGTLEQEARAALGQHEKMLDTLDCLAPYLHDQGKSLFMKAILTIAAADGKIDPKEVELVEAVGEALEMDRSQLKGVLRSLKQARNAS